MKTYKNHVELNYFIGNKMCKHLHKSRLYGLLTLCIIRHCMSKLPKKFNLTNGKTLFFRIRGAQASEKARFIQIKLVAMNSICLVRATMLGADIDWFQLKCIFPLL